MDSGVGEKPPGPGQPGRIGDKKFTGQTRSGPQVFSAAKAIGRLGATLG